MTKKRLLIAAVAGLLVCLTVAWKQDAPTPRLEAPTPEYRDVFRGLVGQGVNIRGNSVVRMRHPGIRNSAYTLTAVGADFLEVTDNTQGGRKTYYPIGSVFLSVDPGK